MVQIENIGYGQEGNCFFIDTEKPALIDAGMAYFAEEQAERIRRRLDGRELEFIFLTHTHYDHAGGLPCIKKAFPHAVVVGSSKAARVLERQGARRVIRELGEEARLQYAQAGSPSLSYDEDLFHVELEAGDGDQISLGNENILILETKGHTNCSISFFLKRSRILIAAESAGFYLGGGKISAPVLTGFSDCLESVEKCRAVNPQKLASCHFGVVDIPAELYFELVEKDICETRDYLLDGLKAGVPEEELRESYVERFWRERPYLAKIQPEEAFRVNAQATIHLVKKEFGL